MNNQQLKTRTLVMTGLFTALIILMANVPFLGYIPLGVIRATLIHIPVIIGAVILGPKYGAFLGFVFGCTSLWTNTMNPTPTSFVFSPFYSLGDMGGSYLSLIICFVPRILVGVISYYVFIGIRRLLKKRKNSDVPALAAAGLAGSLTNTILVMHFIFIFFKEDYGTARGISANAVYGTILGIIGMNGVPEAIVAAIITVAVGKALLAISKSN